MFVRVLLGGILARCQTEVTATTQLSCCAPLQSLKFSFCVCVCVCLNVYVCACTLTSSAFICTPRVKHSGGAWAAECSHTDTHIELGLHVKQLSPPVWQRIAFWNDFENALVYFSKFTLKRCYPQIKRCSITIPFICCLLKGPHQ